MTVQIRDERPEPVFLVRYEALTNRATRRKAARLAAREGLTLEHHTQNVPYRRPLWEKPGKSLARLAELDDMRSAPAGYSRRSTHEGR